MVNANFKIEAKNVEKAYDALKNLGECKGIKNLQLAVQAFGWHITKDGAGTFVKIRLLNSDEKRTKKLFGKLAPFVSENSYVVTVDDDEKETVWDFPVKKKEEDTVPAGTKTDASSE